MARRPRDSFELTLSSEQRKQLAVLVAKYGRHVIWGERTGGIFCPDPDGYLNGLGVRDSGGEESARVAAKKAPEK